MELCRTRSLAAPGNSACGSPSALSHGDVFGLVMKQGFAVTLAGIVAALAAALGPTRLISSVLFSVAPTDPATFIAATDPKNSQFPANREP